MNIAIVGFGVAGKHYLNILLKNKNNIKRIFIINDKKLKKNKNYQQIKAEQLNTVKIDYAFISTPSNLHYKFAKYFIKKKTNILIEKPFVLKLSHAKELIKLSKKFKVKCWIAFQNRYNKALIKLRKTIQEKKLGKINFVDAILLWSRNEKYYKVSWRGKYKTDGGVLANQAIHLLDALLYIFGPIKGYNVIAGFNKKKLQAEDLICLNILHKNNIITSFKATTRAKLDYRVAMDVNGERGRVIVKGISLNEYSYFDRSFLVKDIKHSEPFEKNLGAVSGMGNGHEKIIKEFLNNKIKYSSMNLEVKNNYYLLKLIHSIYNTINNKNNLKLVRNKQSIWGI